MGVGNVPGQATARKRLLLVEDDRTTYVALRGILNLKGWDVSVATTVQEGLAAVRGDKFAAVILDLMLPDGDGEAILEEVRRRAGDAVPVVVTTGVSDVGRVEAVRQMGATAVLRKPIHLVDLLGAISGAP